MIEAAFGLVILSISRWSC